MNTKLRISIIIGAEGSPPLDYNLEGHKIVRISIISWTKGIPSLRISAQINSEGRGGGLGEKKRSTANACVRDTVDLSSHVKV